MKFKIKNCPNCAFWQKNSIGSKNLCYIHEQIFNQPPALVKQIKKEKRELWSNRFLFGGFASSCIFLAFFLFMILVGLSSWIAFLFLTVLVGIGLFVFWMLISLDKITRQTLKQLQKKQSEWIIEN